MTICKKCGRELPDGAPFCCWCGKKQTPEKRRTHRRAQGTGTIRKDPRYASPWIAIAPPAIKGTNGRYLGSFKTQKEAQQALERYSEEKFPTLYNANLEKIYDLWSESHFSGLTQSGIQGYRAAYKSIVGLSSKKFRILKTADFQQCIDEQAEAGASRSKLDKIRQLCSQLCKYAMQNDLIDKNYAEFLKLPKEEKKEKRIFTSGELDLLWMHSDDSRVRFILFMIYTGFRIGEVSAILESNIRLDEGYIIGGEKTEAGRDRVVPLPPAIPEITDFVRCWLASPDSSPFGVSVGSLRQYWFYPALAELGMIDPPVYNSKTRKKEYKNPSITPHCTRHTFASLSVAAGMPPEILQKIIGHADYSTTADIYVHNDISALSAGMSLLSR